MSKALKPLDFHNLSVQVDSATGTTTYCYEFESEPLGVPAAEGYGFAQLAFGDTIGDVNAPGRYTIVRKLGWGSHSSTWLARENRSNEFVAIKLVTDYNMEMRKEGISQEQEAMERISQPPPSEHCTVLLHHFLMEPPRGKSGPHLCYVMPVYGGDISALTKTRNGAPFPYPLAKRMILHVLRGLAHIHSRGIVHTDLKHNNILYTTSASTRDVEGLLRSDPSRKHSPELSYDDTIVEAAVSQFLPLLTDEEALKATYMIADFGSAQPSGKHDDWKAGIKTYRAPEVWLRGTWDKPVDVFAFGCLAYEILTGKPFFVWAPNKKFGLTEEENMFYQMSLRANDYFRPGTSKPIRLPRFTFARTKEVDYLYMPLWKFIGHANVDIPREDLQAISDFLSRCTAISPHERATADELLKDPWLVGEAGQE